jgi:two-component system response regulator TctD
VKLLLPGDDARETARGRRDAALAEALLAAFEYADIQAEFCSTGAGAAELLALYTFDAAVIDRGLPDMDELDLVREVRRAGNRIPVVILTAQSDVGSRIDGLDAGADDYLGKPFLFAELRSRLNAVIRRAEQRLTNTILCGDLAYDLDSRVVSVNGATLDLSPRERTLIDVLMRSRGRPLNAAQLEFCNGASQATRWRTRPSSRSISPRSSCWRSCAMSVRRAAHVGDRLVIMRRAPSCPD